MLAKYSRTLHYSHPKSYRSSESHSKAAQGLKKELTAEIRAINQQTTQTGADSILSVEWDVFGKRKWAERVRAEKHNPLQAALVNDASLLSSIGNLP